MLQAYLGEGDGAFPMSPDVGRMNILENSRERTTGAVWTRAALTRQGMYISRCRHMQRPDYNIYTDKLSNMAG